MDKHSSIYVAGHRGLVGSAVVRELQRQGYQNIITVKSSHVDLRKAEEVEKLFNFYEPEYVFLCAATVGGILANSKKPADFISNNIKIQTNVIEACHKNEVRKLMFCGSGCIYPRDCPQPMKEEYLLTGPLEKTNEAYAIAKLAGLKMCEYYNKQYGLDTVTVMPANVYGPFDNFNLDTAHVVPALIHKFYLGGEHIEIWGDGIARREFIHVDDLAKAMILLMKETTEHDIYNIGTGEELSIASLADHIAIITDYRGEVIFNDKKPSGTPRKLLDSSRILELKWNPCITLRDGLKSTFHWFVENYKEARK